MASEWKKKFDELLAKVAAGGPADQETKDAIAELQAHVAANDTSDTTLTARVTELETSNTEVQTALTDIVTKLQQGDTEGALAAAKNAQENAVGTPDGVTNA